LTQPRVKLTIATNPTNVPGQNVLPGHKTSTKLKFKLYI